MTMPTTILSQQAREFRLTESEPVRLIAFYLPQYHPIPENDAWWGKGFTEWRNVARARPLFRGHYQPHLPADLGFYDLRVPETQVLQAELALQYGIAGFCYYHYWFEGRRLLKRPLDQMLAAGNPELGFCLCWANESWSRRWLGEEWDLLLKQSYSPSDDRRHASWLVRVFADRRYLRVGGRPLFLIYRPDHLPDAQATTEILRESAVRAGEAEPYLVGVDAHRPGSDYRAQGFDATLGFQPQLSVYALDAFSDGRSVRRFLRNLRLGILSSEVKIYDDRESRRRMAAISRPADAIPCVYVGWDNTPRRGRNGMVYVRGGPENLEEAVRAAAVTARRQPPDRQLVFLNAWNEWAEGNHLEPDQRYGHANLEAVARAVRSTQTDSAIERPGTQV